MKLKYFALLFIFLLILSIKYCEKLPFNKTDAEFTNFEKEQGGGFSLYPFGGIGGIQYTIKGEISGTLRIREGAGNDYKITGKIDTTISRDWFNNELGMALIPIGTVKGHLKIHVSF